MKHLVHLNSPTAIDAQLHHFSLSATLASDAMLDEAYHWLCNARHRSCANNDVWHLRFHWATLKPQLQAALRSGTYRFSPCKAVRVDGHSLGIWNAQDALVQKALSLVLTQHLMPHISRHCYHVKGHGGAKAAVAEAHRAAPDYTYVLKSDVRSYYATIDHNVLIAQLRVWIDDDLVLDLIHQFLDHLDDVNGALFPCEHGITKGSSLSPLLGALYLSALDERLGAHAQRHGLRYFRFMDDWMLLCNTRRQLRTGVRIMNQVLDEVGMVKAPDKTFIGRLSKGVDFLGYFLKGRLASQCSAGAARCKKHVATPSG